MEDKQHPLPAYLREERVIILTFALFFPQNINQQPPWDRATRNPLRTDRGRTVPVSPRSDLSRKRRLTVRTWFYSVLTSAFVLQFRVLVAVKRYA